MDLESATLMGLVALGTVNVISFFKPDLKSEVKFALSFAVAFAITFIPAELSNDLLERVKLALGVAFAGSAGVMLANRAGGKK